MGQGTHPPASYPYFRLRGFLAKGEAPLGCTHKAPGGSFSRTGEKWRRESKEFVSEVDVLGGRVS